MASFIKLQTWETKTEAEGDKAKEGRVLLLNPAHIVHIEEKYKLARDKSLKMVELSGVAMFGRGIVDVCETIGEIEGLIDEAVGDE